MAEHDRDFEPADTVDGSQALRDFIDAALAHEETQRPPDYDAAILAILAEAYVRSDGWSAVRVLDRYTCEVELAAPSRELLYDCIKRFYLR